MFGLRWSPRTRTSIRSLSLTGFLSVRRGRDGARVPMRWLHRYLYGPPAKVRVLHIRRITDMGRRRACGFGCRRIRERRAIAMVSGGHIFRARGCSSAVLPESAAEARRRLEGIDPRTVDLGAFRRDVIDKILSLPAVE